jgi:hypothetical protein
MTLPLLRNEVYRGLAVRSQARCWCRSVDDGEIHGRRRGEFSVAVAVYVDLHDHRPPAGPQHPGRSNAKDPLAIMTAVDSPEKRLFASTTQAFCKRGAGAPRPGTACRECAHRRPTRCPVPPPGRWGRTASRAGVDARPRHPRPPAATNPGRACGTSTGRAPSTPRPCRAAERGDPSAAQVADRGRRWHSLAEQIEKTVAAHHGCLRRQRELPPEVAERSTRSARALGRLSQVGCARLEQRLAQVPNIWYARYQ